MAITAVATTGLEPTATEAVGGATVTAMATVAVMHAPRLAAASTAAVASTVAADAAKKMGGPPFSARRGF